MSRLAHDPDVWPPLRSITDIAARGMNVRLRCPGCRYERVLSGPGLWWLFRRRQWDDHMSEAARRLRCSRCWIREHRKQRPTLEQTRDDPTGEPLPDPDTAQWKRLMARYRC
jgi:hypothetical protein